MSRTFLGVLLLSTTLFAQQRERPEFRGSIGLSGGNFDFQTDTRSLDDDTGAGLFQLEFEALAPSRIGGGLRFEGMSSDDDLFVRNGALATEARSSTLFAHFTYRIEEHRFQMPLRVGLMLNGLVLEDDSGLETTYASLGPAFEMEPEVTLVRRGGFRWSLYGQLGLGIAGTAIDVDQDFRDYTSATGFLGLEAGTRLRASHFEFGIAYVGRFQSMDESDVESGQVVLGYDAAYNGVLVTFGVVF